MSHFNGVLFDLDGTLLDTAKDLGNALNHVLSQHDQPSIAFAAYRNVASDGAKGLLELGFGDNFNQLDFPIARQQLLDHYATNICVDTRMFAGVEECLLQLNERAIPWGIVTNKPGWLTDSLLSYFPLLAACNCVFSGDTLSKRKPDPLPLLEAAKLLNLNPGSTLYVGDAIRDIQAANSADMISVAACYGYIDDLNQVRDWQADFTVDHIQQIWQLKCR
ncbi:HAD-IA family hydrolase [Aliiglaciecola sp. LCG003]|uniref:HAD family hydrolase n=1 Tax=Aliiglaciecola sp. LCG003 TaxID=3053655 RepID=UPI002572F567|nr:HAD-IA family hydrolase [Aliiglaciecola sp. LCG003]WJG11156.1 HAD-IA family hydrolase [Aliiglaciecola sp. LCG003]